MLLLRRAPPVIRARCSCLLSSKQGRLTLKLRWERSASVWDEQPRVRRWKGRCRCCPMLPRAVVNITSSSINSANKRLSLVRTRYAPKEIGTRFARRSQIRFIQSFTLGMQGEGGWTAIENKLIVRHKKHERWHALTAWLINASCVIATSAGSAWAR